MWYIALALLAVLTVAYLFLVRRQQSNEWSTLQANREVYESRLAELEEEARENLISEKELNQAKRELQRAFLSDSDNPDEEVHMKPVNIWIIIVLVLVIATGLYIYDGSWKQQREADQARENLPELSNRILRGEGAPPSEEEVWEFALGLRQRLAEQPDAGAWALYGRIMMQLQQIDQALDAFESSRQLDPNRISTLTSYSQALIMSGTDPDLGRAARFIRQIIEEQPENAEALGLLGVVAFERGDFSQAVQAWELTLQAMSPEDPRYEAIERSLEQARARDSGEVMTLTVTVNIHEQLRNEMPWAANLFVFVRDPDGGRAPVAVIRQRITDLPVTVTLTDENVMMEGQSLSDIDQWLVGARLVHGDTIELRPGDMEARPRLIDRQSGQQIELIINEFIE